MRIISGTHKGRKINIPRNFNSRPTTDKAKEALFNIIENRYFLHNKNMLDLFSGTGSISFEFTSRGGKESIAIDNNTNSIASINKNAIKFNLNINAIKSESLTYLKNNQEQFNFVFADPPYLYQKYQQLKESKFTNNIVKKDGLLIIEHDYRTIFEEENVETRKYGTVHFSLFSF